MKLNDEQKKLVEENHSLIYWFANKYHINLEDYYDILAQGLCMAAYHYDPSKCAFSTYASLCMNTAMRREHKRNTQKSKIPEENIYHYENAWSLTDLISTSEKPENKVIDKLNYEYLMSELNRTLKDKDKEVLNYLIEGLTMREIASIIGVSHQCVHNRTKRIREKVKQIYNI